MNRPDQFGGPRRRPAFAMVAAIVLIGFVGVVFVALTSLVRHDLHRTAQARAEAQLRQLLLAGERIAAQSIDAPAAGGPQGVDLPSTLTADGASLSITRGDETGDASSATVDAAFNGLRASQRLTYERRDGRWSLLRAELSPTTGAPKVMPAESTNVR